MGSVPTKFFTTTQNNSGGSFDHDEAKGIGFALCVEAVDAQHAEARMQSIVDSYPAGYNCPCCGDRWSFYIDREDAEDEPSLYGEPLRGGWGIPSYVHYLDGRIESRGTEQAA